MDLKYKEAHDLSPKLTVDWDYCVIDDITNFTVYLKLGNETLMKRSFNSKELTLEFYNKIRRALE